STKAPITKAGSTAVRWITPALVRVAAISGEPQATQRRSGACVRLAAEFHKQLSMAGMLIGLLAGHGESVLFIELNTRRVILVHRQLQARPLGLGIRQQNRTDALALRTGRHEDRSQGVFIQAVEPENLARRFVYPRLRGRKIDIAHIPDLRYPEGRVDEVMGLDGRRQPDIQNGIDIACSRIADHPSAPCTVMFACRVVSVVDRPSPCPIKITRAFQITDAQGDHADWRLQSGSAAGAQWLDRISELIIPSEAI